MLGTLLCAIADTYEFLLIARIVTGIFGGVIGSVGFAIISDLFPFEVRGRVMGFVQMSFAASQILGLPIGLSLANKFGWHSPFWMIVGFGILVGLVMLIYMKPVTDHLNLKTKQNAFQHLIKTFSVPDYVKTYLSTVLLATGGFMLMPFGSAFSTNNLGLTLEQLPMVYMIVGLFSIVTGPLVSSISDKVGKFKVFAIGTLLSCLMVAIYTPLGVTPVWVVITISVLMFAGITCRMITSSALMSAVPQPQDRGAFMSINSSIQQISGGIASAIAGLIVYQAPNGTLQRYDLLGYVVIATMLITIATTYWIDRHVSKMMQNKQQANCLQHFKNFCKSNSNFCRNSLSRQALLQIERHSHIVGQLLRKTCAALR